MAEEKEVKESAVKIAATIAVIFAIFNIFPSFVFCSGTFIDYDEVNKLEKKSKKYIWTGKKLLSENSTFTENKNSFESKAFEAWKISKSRDFQTRVEVYRRILLSLLNNYYFAYIKKQARENDISDELVKNYPDFYASRGKGLFLKPDERIYIFISSSVPVETLRNFVRDSGLIHGRVYFILRGGVKGLTYIRPTVSWIISLMKKDPDCDLLREKCELYRAEFWIDPLLFRQYHVDVVPQVVYVKGEDEVVVASPGAVSLACHLGRIGKILKDQRFTDFSYLFSIY